MWLYYLWKNLKGSLWFVFEIADAELQVHLNTPNPSVFDPSIPNVIYVATLLDPYPFCVGVFVQYIIWRPVSSANWQPLKMLRDFKTFFILKNIFLFVMVPFIGNNI